MLLYSLCVTVLVLPMGVMPQDESPNPSSGSGSGSGTIFPLTTLSSLTQLQKDNLVTIGFTGMTVDNFMEVGTIFQEAVVNAINDYFDIQIAKRQTALTPSDVKVVDIMDMDSIVMVVFVVTNENLLINSAEMIDIMQIEGPRIAQDLQNGLAGLGISASVGFAGVMGVAPSSAPESSAPQTLSQSTIIAIAVAGIVSVILLAVVILAVSVYTFRKRKQAKAESASADYVEVPAEDGNSFSSKWQPLKVSTRGDYEVVPTSFSKKDSESDANTHTAL